MTNIISIKTLVDLVLTMTMVAYGMAPMECNTILLHSFLDYCLDFLENVTNSLIFVFNYPIYFLDFCHNFLDLICVDVNNLD